jgi:hypothetical protein
MQTVQMTSEELKLSQHDLVVASSKLLGVFKKATPLAFYSHLIQWFYPVFSSMVSCCFHRFFRSNGGGFACTGTYSINLLSSASSFSRGLEHCNYVLWRNIHQDIVNRLKHEPATRSPNRYELARIHSPGPNQEFRAARVCRVSQPLLQKVT